MRLALGFIQSDGVGCLLNVGEDLVVLEQHSAMSDDYRQVEIRGSLVNSTGATEDTNFWQVFIEAGDTDCCRHIHFIQSGWKAANRPNLEHKL